VKRPADDEVLGRSVLGRYRIVRKLARGGMGAVYLARTEGAEGFTRPVVVKRVLPTLMDDPEVAQLFVREARILADLQHPNIVSVIDFGQQDDGAYVTVFEYVNGYSLGEWCRFLKGMNEQVPVELALHIVLRVLAALDYAHTFRRRDGKPLQVIHRDVSPSNVLLNEQGSVKLLDFGIAQVSGDSVEVHTQRPRIRGKLPYVPLEIFKGEPATVQTDVYAAGVVLHELLTGSNPFMGREAADILHKVSTVIPPSVHATRDDAPEEIDVVLARALKRDPKQRYRSAAEFAAALRALRKLPEEEATRRLAERLCRDFDGPIAHALGLDPLEAREQAWRDPQITSFAPGAPISVQPIGDPPPPAGRFSLVPHEAVTVSTEISPQLLAGASRSLEPEPEPEIEIEPDAEPEPEPAASAAAKPAVSGQRIAWIAALSSLVGAGAAAVAWLAIVNASPAQPVIIVERPPPGRAVAPPPEIAPVEAPAPAVVPAEPVEGRAGEHEEAGPSAVESAASEPAVQKREPAPPNPRALTRAFERRSRQVEACFDRHAAGLEGQPRLSLRFRVGTSGQVLGVELSPPAVAGTALGRCLLEVAQTTRFQPQREELSFHIPITAQAKP
jgi:eukaryotic-like serine/threonine-protein kinase